MGLAIAKSKTSEEGIVADRKLWLDASRDRVVEHGSAESAFLLANEGSLIPASEARRLGLSVKDGKVHQDRVVQVAALRKELAEVEGRQKAHAEKIAAHKTENAVKDTPSEMEAERVALDAEVESVRQVLAQAIKAAAVKAEAEPAPAKKKRKK